jgi:hypothetical protein
MTIRRLSVPIEIDSSQTRCGECHFQHPETSLCVLFGISLEKIWKGSNPQHKRLKDCAIAEWRAKKQEQES